jgi:sodium/hydrogen antiporter
VLFCDASGIKLGALRRQAGVPVRLLGIGLPLTIGWARSPRPCLTA